jgi:hypothetical protein
MYDHKGLRIPYNTNSQIKDEVSKIAQMETTFKDKSMMCYMKYKATTPMGHIRSLIEIKRDILK